MEGQNQTALVEFQRRESGGQIEVASTRQAAEVQAAMVVAKRFPRDETAAFARIMAACKRKTLADQALYAYPRGGETVTGPSIRLAEALAQAWGNVDCGLAELDQRNGETIMQACAWDLESNTRIVRTFSVRHERHTRNGVKKLTDPRDIYELGANQGARRLRACILAVIPGDVVEAAVSECEKTMQGDNSEPIADRARKMVAAFAEMGVTQAQIEKRLGHKVSAIQPTELVHLQKVFRALRDGMGAVADYFEGDAPAKRGVDLAAAVEGTPAPKEQASAADPTPNVREVSDADVEAAAAQDAKAEAEKAAEKPVEKAADKAAGKVPPSERPKRRPDPTPELL